MTLPVPCPVGCLQGGYKKLAALSALGLLCLTAVIVLGIYTGAAVIAEHGARITEIPAPQLEHLPAATSIFVFAFAAHGIFPVWQLPAVRCL